MRTHLTTLLAVLAAAAAITLGAVGIATAGPPSATAAPAADTILEVTGDKDNGFGIHYYDGSAIFPPTDSEARAECSEYDTAAARIRCRTEVRIWYRDLGDLKQALAHAHAQ
ncbi:MAG: hypothetical protein WKF79_03780 [Nocardioides sp.]